LDNPTAIDDQLIAQNLYSDNTIIGRDVIDNYHHATYDGNTTPQILIAKPGVYDEYERVPQYITIKSVGKSSDPTKYNLYKYAGFTNVKGTVVPVYTFIPKKGWHEAGGFDIYEYGDCQFAVNGQTVGFNPTQESIK
jgi:hypothetical protein